MPKKHNSSLDNSTTIPSNPQLYESNRKTKPEPRINRSTKLRKYASVYKSYVRKTEQSNTSKSPRRSRQIISDKSKKLQYKTHPHESKQVTNVQKEHNPIGDITKKINIYPVSLNNTPKKSLNAYQKFVQSESKKEKYKNLPGKERLSIIADSWKKLNK